MDMELDELKNRWKQLDNHVKSQDEKIRQLTDQVIAGKVKSPLTTLRRHCIIAAVAVPFLLPFFFWTYSFVGLTCGETQKTLLYALTYLFVSFIFFRELFFVIELKKINVSKTSAIESLKRTIRFRQQYKWGVVIGLFLGIAFLMVDFASMNQEFMIGGIFGGIIGGFLGAKMWRFYNRTINDLESALREWNEE
jgi:hypothetical protein